ncbi:MAG TPA: carboxypeptidase-like regulatory domain-containing protein [Longimicrobiales bacterium]|nr:carboxypeptidase-like regulatory domain-containing protein [Longimicrobiales bacterium]
MRGRALEPREESALATLRQPLATKVANERLWRRALAATAVTAGLAVSAPTEAQVVIGHVLDEATRAPLAAVAVTALDASGREQASVGTDSAGSFVLPLAQGLYALRLERLGYHALTTEPIEVRGRETITLELRLGAEAIPLEPLVVVGRVRAAVGTAAFYRRMAYYGASGVGRFYTRAQIDSASTTDIHTLLKRDPAVRLLQSRCTLGSSRASASCFNDVVIFDTRGVKCLPGLFVNGVRMRNDAETDLTTLFRPGDIEGIEVYPSEAFAPPELHVEGCGSLAIWTRAPEGGNPFTLRRILTAAGVAAGLLLMLRL